MQPILLDIPVYVGGYRMDADALQARMVEVRDSLVSAVLSYDDRAAIRYALQAQGRDSTRELNEGYLVRVQELLPERLDRRDPHGWSVAELLAEFQRLGKHMADEFGVVA